jgi:hypothetical protein
MGELQGLPPPLEVLADAPAGMGPSQQHLQRRYRDSAHDRELQLLTQALQKALLVPQSSGFPTAQAFLTALGLQHGQPGRVTTNIYAAAEQARAAGRGHSLGRIDGLVWQQESDTLKICEFACGTGDVLSAPQQEALRQITAMIKNVPGNEEVDRLFRATRVTLAHSSARSISLLNKLDELSEQLRGSEIPGKYISVRHL